MDERYSDEEIESILNRLEETLEDPEEFINSSFNALLFLGDSLKSDTEDLVDINLRLCQAYYTKHENYEKLKQLRDFALSLVKQKKIEVDHGIIENISINLN